MLASWKKGKLDIDFSYRTAIPYEPGVTRRDPSPVIQVNGTYYVWYSRATEGSSGFYASVYYAKSKDGIHWQEVGEAIPKGGKNEWDEYGVYTPTVLVAEDRYYLYYTGIGVPFTDHTRNGIGVAVADSPDGPWTKYEGNPVLLPSDKVGDFDSHRIDDTCLIKRDGKYWMYYKGRCFGYSPAFTKMGVAIAEKPTGPFVKYEGNPVISSGHEVCVWPCGNGVATMLVNVGPQRNTLQYSEDGLHFEIVGKLPTPKAAGPYREDHYQEGYGKGIRWGICMTDKCDWPYLLRFDVKGLAEE